MKEQKKVCKKCNIIKPISQFYQNKAGKYGVVSKCKVCCKEYGKKRYHNNPNHIKKIIEKYHKNNPLAKTNANLKFTYGINLDDYNIILENQNNKCGICEKSIKKNKRRFDVDHCHKTNSIRGLLCPKCNKGIGLFNDNVKILKKAIEYLENAYLK